MAGAERLEDVVAAIRACRHCIEQPQGKPLPHEPNPVLRVSRTARLCIAGQAPGTRVHASGVPFADPSGVRLRDWLGVSEEEFYDQSRIAIVPMGFCFPGLDDKGGDLPPRRECTRLWHDRLFARLPQIELFVLVGQYAHRWHLGKRAEARVSDTVAMWKRHAFGTGEAAPAIPLPHPSWRNNAWLKKNPWFERDVLPHLRAEVRRLLG